MKVHIHISLPTPGGILLNKKPNITIDIFKTFCVLIEVGKAREEVSYVMGEVAQWLLPNCNTYLFIFFHPIHNYREYWLFRIYRITVCVTHPCNPFLLLLLPYRMKANLLFFPLPTLLTPWENLIWLQWTVVCSLSYQIKILVLSVNQQFNGRIDRHLQNTRLYLFLAI